MKKPCAFKPGQRVRCIDPIPGRLTKGAIYTVTDTADLGPPTALLTLAEIPEVLFHPRRFEKAHSDD
jgi:hypothetical protein